MTDKQKLINLIEDIQAVLKNASKTPNEKNNLIYSITETYRK